MEFLELVGSINSRLATKLTARQIENARAVYNESVVGGIDPRLTLAIAWRESKLGVSSAMLKGDTNRGEDHALGTMQVLRSTARGLGMEADWLKNKAQYVKTGATDPQIDARMGIGLLKELATKNKATTLGDMAAGYNGGAKFVGKDYGPTQGYVSGVAKSMGEWFGDGKSASWKQPTVLAGGVLPTMALGAMSSMPRASSSPAISPMASNAAPQVFAPESLPSMTPAAAAPKADTGAFANLLPDPLATGGGVFDFTTTAKKTTSGQDPFSFNALLAPIQSQQDDPIDALRAMLSSEYDRQYQTEEA